MVAPSRKISQGSLVPVSQLPFWIKLPEGMGQMSCMVVAVTVVVSVATIEDAAVRISLAVASSVAVVDSVAVTRSVWVTVSVAVTKIVVIANSVAIAESVSTILEVLVAVTDTITVLRIVAGGDAASKIQEQALDSLAVGYVTQTCCELTALFSTRARRMVGVEIARGCIASRRVLVVVVEIVTVVVSVRVVVWL
jgi:hypothetical protein